MITEEARQLKRVATKKWRDARKNDPKYIENRKLYAATWRAANRAAINKRQNEKRLLDVDAKRAAARARQVKYNKAHPKRKLLISAKVRARQRGLVFTITEKDLVIPTHCPILGIPLTFDGRRSSSPSLDRVNPELGYTPKNCRVISDRANVYKSNMSIETVERLLDYMKFTAD